jgi:hypothetical protein
MNFPRTYLPEIIFTISELIIHHSRHMSKSFLLCIGLAMLVISSCKTENPTQSTDNSSFGMLQSKVFNKTCTGCHTQGTDYGIQSGLILDANVAYQNLVGVKAHYINAATDGLLRVKQGNADSSFLYIKVHGFPQGKEYGLHMPLGITSLSIGQQKFIHDWINAGAPQTGVVADATLLDDTTHYPSPDFTPLDKPAQGTGFQVETGQFNVASNFEREIFIYRDLGNTAPVYINHIHTKMRPNSHHLLIYTLDTSTPAFMIPPFNQIRDLRNPDGSYNSATENLMLYHNFVGGSMIEEDDYHFPPGVGLLLPAHAGIDVNSHFVNYTGAAIEGEAYANLYTVDPANVQYPAQTLLLSNNAIALPANKQTVVTYTQTNDYPVKVNIFMLTSHYHSHGQKFQIQIVGGARDGEIIYESTDWSHPLEKVFDPPVVLNQGEGIRSVVTYLNNTTSDIQFGFKSTDEMDIMLGYYYLTY